MTTLINIGSTILTKACILDYKRANSRITLNCMLSYLIFTYSLAATTLALVCLCLQLQYSLPDLVGEVLVQLQGLQRGPPVSQLGRVSLHELPHIFREIYRLTDVALDGVPGLRYERNGSGWAQPPHGLMS
jgi:hypothetical protein